MKTLQLYLTRQIVASLFMTVLVFTFVLLLGNALKELLQYMINGQVKFGLVAEAAGLLIPFVWVFALPMGMLTATLLIFGRFSADQELTAVRSSGISLLSLISPILVLSLILCGVSAFLNLYVGPSCRVAYNNLRYKLEAQFTSAYLPAGFIKDFPGYIFYVGKNRKGDLEDVIVFAQKNGTNIFVIQSPRAKLEPDMANRRLNLTLFDCKHITLGGGRALSSFGEVQLQLDLQKENKRSEKPPLSDMTFWQLLDEVRDLKAHTRALLTQPALAPEQRLDQKNALEHGLAELLTPVLFQIHRQVAFSFACFAFTLVGIPLGIRVHRRETNIGIAIALLLVLAYFSFIFLGQSLNTHAEYRPYLLVWVPNFLFETIGALLLWKANRGG